jgi:hypothetical protein
LSRRGPLASATFRHLAGAYTTNELGNWIGEVALAILVFDRTGSPLATATLFLCLRFAPAILAPLLTSHLEALPARVLLPALNLAEAVIFGGIALLAHSFVLPVVLVLSALDGIVAIAAKAITRNVTVVTLTARDQLREGNAILNLGFAAGGAAGPAVAGVVVAAFGVGSALAIDAVSFALVAVLLASASDLVTATNREVTARQRLRAGLSGIGSRLGIRRLLGAQAIALVFFVAVIPIEVVFAKRTLHAGDSGYGFLLAGWGAGMIIGGAAFAAARQARLITLLGTSTALIAVGYAGLAAAPNLVVACLMSAVGGVGNGAQAISFQTALQENIPPEEQSTVMAMVDGGGQIMQAIGFTLGGAIAAATSPRIAYLVAAVGVFCVLIFLCARPIGELRAPAAVGVGP